MLNKNGYIEFNRNITMNLKERGITIGDLVILSIIIFTTATFVKSFNKDKKTTLNHSYHGELSYEKTLFSEMHLNNYPYSTDSDFLFS